MKMYLDVDDTINAHMPTGWGRTTNKYVRIEGYPHAFRMRWAPRLIEALRALPVEYEWLTSWRSDAPTSLGPVFEFGEGFPATVQGHGGPLPIDVKLSAITRRHHWDDTFVWADNELTDDHRGLFKNALLVTPNERMGLRPEDLEWVTEYLQERSDS